MSEESTPCPCCGHAGPATAEPSYEPFEVKNGSAHHRVLKALQRRSLTAEEVALKVWLSPNETASRLLELRRAGYVEYRVDARTRRVMERLTSRDTPAKVQIITARGRDILAKLR